MKMNRIAVGVDLGGSFIKSGLVNARGEILRDTTISAEASKGPRHVIEQITKSVHQLIDRSSYKKKALVGIGVGAPGSVDLDGGTVKYPPNFPGWKVVRLGEALHEEFGLHVEVDNDANAAALGEAKFGAGLGHEDFIMVTLGTGVGGGLFLDGKIFRGPFGGAGELGHTSINYNGPLCNCGNRGCVEAYVGAKYITRRAIERLRNNPTSKILALVKGNIKRIDPKIISLAAQEGDPTALDVFAETGMYLGVGLANLVNLLDVRLVIIGGGIARAGKPLFDPVRKSLRSRVLKSVSSNLEVLPAKLGNSAGILGAAALIL